MNRRFIRGGMTMLCVGLVTVATALAAMRIGGVTHWSFLMIKHIFIGFLFGAAWGIESPVFLNGGLGMTGVETIMFLYEQFYLKRLLHVEPEDPSRLDPLQGTRLRLHGQSPYESPQARWLRGEPVEAPRHGPA